MNCFSRAWCSIIRKPLKSILLLLVVCVISLFLLSGLASQNSSIDIQDNSRQAIGAGLLLEGNEANRGKRLQEIGEQIDGEGSLHGVHQEKLESASGTQWKVWTDNSFDTLILDDIEKISSISEISDYNITTVFTAVNPVNFKRIEDPDVDQAKDIKGVTLIGDRDMSMNSSFLSGNAYIKEGRMVERSDTDVCVISEELAAMNNLKVGDSLQFNNYHDIENSTIYEAKIIGIYQVKQKMSPFMSGDTFRSENVIFTDLRFPEKPEGNEDNPLYAKAYFKVKDVKQYEAAKNAVKKVPIDWERYDLIDNNGTLDTMSSNFNDLECISEALTLVIVGASFVILFLIFVFWMKNRIQEIGIFLSLGISKFEILSQILIEAIMISVVALFISFIFAPTISKAATNYLVTQQNQQAEEQKALDSGKVSTEYKLDQSITDVNVEITADLLMIDGLVIIVLITTTITIAGVTILRKQPKDILSEIS